MFHLENVHISSDLNHIDCRFPVQHVVKTDTEESTGFQGYTGQVAGGVFRKGDEVKILPSGKSASIKSIHLGETHLEECFAPLSVMITLNEQLSVSRGDMIVRPNNLPVVADEIEMMICWFNEIPLCINSNYLLRHTTHEVNCTVHEIYYQIDISTLHRLQNHHQIEMNGIGRIKIKTSEPLLYDSYRRNRNTGSIIMINPITFETVAAGMIL